MSEENKENKIIVTDRRRISSDSDNKEAPEYERKYPTYIEHLQEQLSSKDDMLKHVWKSYKRKARPIKSGCN